MILSRTADAACSARLACSSEIITSLNEISWLPEANAFAFSFAEAIASSTRLSAALRALENAAPGAPAALGSAGSGMAAAGALSRFEIEDSADNTPATAVIMGIIFPSLPPFGWGAGLVDVAASARPNVRDSHRCLPGS